jgi:hypothetical protein
MRPGVFTTQPRVRGREPLRWELAASAVVLGLALATAIAGLTEPASVHAAYGRGGSQRAGIAQGAPLSARTSAQQQPSMQPDGLASQEWAAIAGASPNVQLHHPGVVGRGRAKFQPDTQTVLRLLRERQDAIITALTQRMMRDASVPGAASHTADRPLIVTRPLRGPPARG